MHKKNGRKVLLIPNPVYNVRYKAQKLCYLII